MSDPAPEPFLRPNFSPGGDPAFVYFVVYGAFAGDGKLRLAAPVLHTPDFRQRIQVRHFSRQKHPAQFPDEVFLRAANAEPSVTEAVRSAPECVYVAGEFADPVTLHYLADVIALVGALLDAGGVAVAHSIQLQLFSAEEWNTTVRPAPDRRFNRFTTILSSAEADDSTWYHTRGLRLFGRPDLSLHGVTRECAPMAVELFERFIAWQIGGAQIAEGQEIRMRGLPAGMRCHHAGNPDDPDFNNRHVEIHWRQANLA